jgi:hypothetical protein
MARQVGKRARLAEAFEIVAALPVTCAAAGVAERTAPSAAADRNMGNNRFMFATSGASSVAGGLLF